VVSGPEEMRKVVRMFLKYGVDSIKLNLSGDNLTPASDAKTTWMSDEKSRWRCARPSCAASASPCTPAPARSVKQAVRHGCEVIYHCSFTDEEALDLLEANKDKVFVAPGLSVIVRLLYDGAEWGFSREKAVALGYEAELEAVEQSLRAMHKRGRAGPARRRLRFAWARHGENAMTCSISSNTSA